MVQYPRSSFAGLALILVAGCGSEATDTAALADDAALGRSVDTAASRLATADDPTSKAAPSSAEPPAAPADLSGARALIENIYSRYRDSTKVLDVPFTPELEASIDKQSDDGNLGYDMFCECQDPGDPGMLRHTIRSLEPTPDGAVARVSFVIGGPPSTALTIRLARRGTKWAVADVIGDDGSLLEKGR